MNNRLAAVLLLAGSAVLGSASASLAQTAAPAPPAATNAAPAPFVMTLGDMMNTLVQPRHAKLGLAGQAQNWPLAAYALLEIQQAFAAISKSIPRFGGMPVAELIGAAVSQPMAALKAAINARDPQKFAAAYGQLTQGCNACHASLDHPFVVIKTPDASAFANQDFSPRH
jgi:hypothetical protein